MQEIRNNQAVIAECEATLRLTEARIDALEDRLLTEKLTNRKFMQLYNERGNLMLKRRTALKKLEYARKGKNPWGVAETVVK